MDNVIKTVLITVPALNNFLNLKIMSDVDVINMDHYAQLFPDSCLELFRQ